MSFINILWGQWSVTGEASINTQTQEKIDKIKTFINFHLLVGENPMIHVQNK